ncbi:tight adherence protein B [Mumia flava]|uniref:Tight adherence protein B n=1 Tax=Mumia flava TaxID=1348852 RepID=A0A0B2BRB9_9ACTN|nr:type II secretion system F family protein [Mumia flava]PJJ58585.1 tight adherence protein B [Mumia flava]
MGTIVGLVMGIGLLLTWSGLTTADARRSRRAGRGPSSALTGLLIRAGVESVRPRGLVLVCIACATLGALVALVVSAVPAIALIGGLAAGWTPVVVLRARAHRIAEERAACWPEAVDHLASGVRAGLSLPEAIAAVGERGPEPLREPFAVFARDYQRSGRFHDCLDALKERLADPVGDRLAEALRVARDVGGGDLGRMLRTLSAFLRDEARTRGELVARQSWTVNGARLAVSAPWIVLALMSLRRDAISAFGTSEGLVVLLGGLAACVVAYRLMLRIGRLPREPRVLR